MMTTRPTKEDNLEVLRQVAGWTFSFGDLEVSFGVTTKECWIKSVRDYAVKGDGAVALAILATRMLQERESLPEESWWVGESEGGLFNRTAAKLQKDLLRIKPRLSEKGESDATIFDQIVVTGRGDTKFRLQDTVKATTRKPSVKPLFVELDAGNEISGSWYTRVTRLPSYITRYGEMTVSFQEDMDEVRRNGGGTLIATGRNYTATHEGTARIDRGMTWRSEWVLLRGDQLYLPYTTTNETSSEQTKHGVADLLHQNRAMRGRWWDMFPEFLRGTVEYSRDNPASNRQVGINIALVPSIETKRALLDLVGVRNCIFPFDYVNGPARLHFTLAAAAVHPADLPSIYSRFLAMKESAGELKLTAVVHEGVPLQILKGPAPDCLKGRSIKVLDVVLNNEIRALHNSAVNCLKDVAQEGSHSVDDCDHLTAHYLHSYFVKHSGLSFKPHITLGFAGADNAALSKVRFDGIGLFSVGPGGTCIELLR